jgi:hypothetical protein
MDSDCQQECVSGIRSLSLAPSKWFLPPMAPIEPVRRTAVSRAVLRIVTQVWLLVLVVGSLQPARPRFVTGVHREIHWLAFAGAEVFMLCLSRTRRQGILATSAILLLGVSLEVLQHLIYRNPMEWRDTGDDGLAILVAFALYQLTAARKPRADPRP